MKYIDTHTSWTSALLKTSHILYAVWLLLEFFVVTLEVILNLLNLLNLLKLIKFSKWDYINNITKIQTEYFYQNKTSTTFKSTATRFLLFLTSVTGLYLWYLRLFLRIQYIIPAALYLSSEFWTLYNQSRKMLLLKNGNGNHSDKFREAIYTDC